MSPTGYTLAVAIAGEGYVQGMDGDGNIFYTKAGMLDIDSEGNVVDVNGNFVLGTSGNPTGKNPGSQKIKISIPYENAKSASVEDTINNVGYTITASNENEAGNVNFVFATSTKMPIGQKVEAKVTSSAIVVTLNANETFGKSDDAGFTSALDELNSEINRAITSANGGVEHAGGTFTIDMLSGDAGDIAGITGQEIVNADFGVKSGSMEYVDTEDNPLPTFAKNVRVSSVGDKFSGNGQRTMTCSYNEGTLTINVAGDGDSPTYVGTVNPEQLKAAGTVKLAAQGDNADPDDYIVVTYPSDSVAATYGTDASGMVDLTASEPSKNWGLAQGNFLLAGGTEGGEQTVADLTGIAINDKGVITATHPTFGLMEIGRVDLATFANPAGLFQAGNTYFQQSLNSGEPQLCIAGTDGTGAILGGTLETSNTDLSQEMTDMITTQRGFQACSRLITVSDTMLEELINLKR
jgi:flagellar hook protein FlgE